MARHISAAIAGLNQVESNRTERTKESNERTFQYACHSQTRQSTGIAVPKVRYADG